MVIEKLLTVLLYYGTLLCVICELVQLERNEYMLEARELYKVYKPKKGVAVTAINKISLKFPEKGMVFLLGKSGSGKSTLLNLLGGLDKYDGGEIIIKGVSSKDFNQQHFDSYRNTYVGFIFQEYNVLDEFSVGANIALALELQGRKATDEEINKILHEVDLDGYGNRKPNELSGGQKQRVAIARALVKNPEIIMADEPTGALDSKTGRQVFDTLKKLSKDKLVIIVSHDRDFSELYADRIIELADGNVISDVELADNEALADNAIEDTALKFSGDTIEVSAGYHLTEDDRVAINEYIDKMTDKDIKLKLSDKSVLAKKFVPTNQDKIETQDGAGFKLIKSKLPLKNAFKIGSSGLKYKKFRLVMTILLSCVAFGLFGLADTFGSYDHVDTCTNSLVDSGIDYVSLEKAKKVGEGVNEYYISYNQYLSETDIENIEKQMGKEFIKVYKPINTYLGFYEQVDPSAKFTETDYVIHDMGFVGFGEITKEKIDEFGYKILAGELPDGKKDEIAISKYVYETFHLGKYTDGVADENGKINYEQINSYDDLIGKKLYMVDKEYTITAIIDTNVDLERYTVLTEKDENKTSAEQLAEFALLNEFNYIRAFSLAGVAMVGDGYVDRLLENKPNIYALSEKYMYLYTDVNDYWLDPTYLIKMSDIKDMEVIWLDNERTELGDKELIITMGMLENMGYTEEDLKNDEFLNSLKSSLFNADIYSTFDLYDEGEVESDYKIVGILKPTEENKIYGDTIVASENLFNRCINSENGDYICAIGPMPETKEEIEEMVAFCYEEGTEIRYQMLNAVTYELDMVNTTLKAFSKIFLYIGIGFAVFASLMLANFIGTSISHKKQEIGILRAIGSRSNDVFRIFFSESFIIALINFVLSAIGVFALTNMINSLIRNELGVLVTVLNFGPRQIILLFMVSIIVAFLASFLPVKKIASKRPIDAIRNR